MVSPLQQPQRENTIMKKDTKVAVVQSAPTFLQSMTTDVNVGINEVVSVFISRWETSLHAKKDELGKKIKTVKQQIADLTSQVLSVVDHSQYEMTVPQLSLQSKVGNVNAVWNEDTHKTKKNHIEVEVKIFDTSNPSRDYPVHTKNVKIAIGANDVQHYNQLSADLSALNTNLVETMGEIKQVSRKERQVRGTISEKRLAESGLSGLINDPEMLRLIEVK
jgi:hypothetical protein